MSSLCHFCIYRIRLCNSFLAILMLRLRILLYALRLNFSLWYWTDSVMSNFSFFSYKLSLFWMEFKIPAVIYSFSLCLHLLKRTVISGKCLSFASIKQWSKILKVSFGSVDSWLSIVFIVYVNLHFAHAPGMPGTFPPPPTSSETAS